ncbi:MAG: hypothetical protein VYC80_03930, partial [Planctomycetota bacterium]|nr:hypothetical protein [Planctomycetota bacterium]
AVVNVSNDDNVTDIVPTHIDSLIGSLQICSSKNVFVSKPRRPTMRCLVYAGGPVAEATS